MNESLIEVVLAIKRWARRRPMEWPKSKTALNEIISTLNRGELELQFQELELFIGWYIHHRTGISLLNCLDGIERYCVEPYLVGELSEWGHDPCTASPRSFALQCLANIDHGIFHLPYSIVSETRYPPLGFEFFSALKLLARNHRNDILLRLILDLRAFSDFMHNFFLHIEAHSKGRVDASICRSIQHDWATGPASLGVSVRSTVRELLDALRRTARDRLAGVVAEPAEKIVFVGRNQGHDTQSRMSMAKKEACCCMARGMFKEDPTLTFAKIAARIAKIGHVTVDGEEYEVSRSAVRSYIRGIWLPE